MLRSLLLVFATFQVILAVEFQIENRSPQNEYWIGIQGNPGKENLNNGGFVLGPGQVRVLNAAEDWAGRFWARSYCDPNSQHCETGDCGNRLECGGNGGNPPATLAEITLKGADGLDFYDLSLVDGFNIAASFEPVNGQGDGGQYSCARAQCIARINEECPEQLRQVSNIGGNPTTVGCKSACLAFNDDFYCCRNQHDKPETCRHEDWPVDYSEFFKTRCPDAYSYAYDDRKSTFTCKAEKYIITFGG